MRSRLRAHCDKCNYPIPAGALELAVGIEDPVTVTAHCHIERVSRDFTASELSTLVKEWTVVRFFDAPKRNDR